MLSHEDVESTARQERPLAQSGRLCGPAVPLLTASWAQEVRLFPGPGDGKGHGSLAGHKAVTQERKTIFITMNTFISKQVYVY